MVGQILARSVFLMTVVFVHGVPDTHRVWDRLAAALPLHEGVALSLPGFGCDMPAGFVASKEDYVAWLLRALRALPPPLDIVSHDWGFLIAARALAIEPQLARSFVGGGLALTRDYTWHDTARVWQTPKAGERLMDRMDASIWVAMLQKAGVPPGAAGETSAHIDRRMMDAILSLYRSGRDVFHDWDAGFSAITMPTLLLWGDRDIYASPAFAVRASEAIGGPADVKILPDCGHWWQLEAPERAASAISAFWSGLGVSR